MARYESRHGHGSMGSESMIVRREAAVNALVHDDHDDSHDDDHAHDHARSQQHEVHSLLSPMERCSVGGKVRRHGSLPCPQLHSQQQQHKQHRHHTQSHKHSQSQSQHQDSSWRQLEHQHRSLTPHQKSKPKSQADSRGLRGYFADDARARIMGRSLRSISTGEQRAAVHSAKRSMVPSSAPRSCTSTPCLLNASLQPQVRKTGRRKERYSLAGASPLSSTSRQRTLRIHSSPGNRAQSQLPSPNASPRNGHSRNQITKRNQPGHEQENQHQHDHPTSNATFALETSQHEKADTAAAVAAPNEQTKPSLRKIDLVRLMQRSDSRTVKKTIVETAELCKQQEDWDRSQRLQQKQQQFSGGARSEHASSNDARPPVQELEAIEAWARDSYYRIVMTKNNVLPVVVTAMKVFSHHPTVQASCCEILQILLKADDRNQVVIEQLGGIGQAIAALRRYPQNTRIQTSACLLLQSSNLSLHSIPAEYPACNLDASHDDILDPQKFTDCDPSLAASSSTLMTALEMISDDSSSSNSTMQRLKELCHSKV